MTMTFHLHSRRMRCAVLGGLLILSCACAQSASFDCTKATLPIERQICSHAGLSLLDEELAETFSMRVQEEDAVAQLVSQLRTSQRAWVRSRNTCKSAQCLQQSYERRIAELACMDGPALASAIGVSTCASAELRRMDHELVARDPARAQGLEAWRAARGSRCLKEGQAAGGAPGWQSASALQCEVKATQERLARR
jgi:uncharacterized protein